MKDTIHITCPRIDNSDNGFSLTLNGKWLNLASTVDLPKLNAHNLRLMLDMSYSYDAQLKVFNEQFVSKYITQFDLTNESPVETYEAYSEIDDEVFDAFTDRNN